MHTTQTQSFAELLQSAVEEPGTLSAAYQQFHSYSLGNQLLAMFQCQERGLKPGPLATFPRWKELGRHVRKGEKALTLKRRRDATADAADSSSATFTRFVYRARWFVLAQKRGAARAERADLGRSASPGHTRGRRSPVRRSRWQHPGLCA